MRWRRRTTIIMTTDADTVLLRLLTWLSPAFPTGAFAYSHGLEWAVAAGDIASEADLLPWIEDVLVHGAGRSDAILLRHAYRAADGAALAGVAELAEATTASRERRAETVGQGDAFGIAARVWGAPLLEGLEGGVAYPVAVGALARAHAVRMPEAARNERAQTAQTTDCKIACNNDPLRGWFRVE